jgi:hypothetical protein
MASTEKLEHIILSSLAFSVESCEKYSK